MKKIYIRNIVVGEIYSTSTIENNLIKDNAKLILEMVDNNKTGKKDYIEVFTGIKVNELKDFEIKIQHIYNYFPMEQVAYNDKADREMLIDMYKSLNFKNEKTK